MYIPNKNLPWVVVKLNQKYHDRMKDLYQHKRYLHLILTKLRISYWYNHMDGRNQLSAKKLLFATIILLIIIRFLSNLICKVEFCVKSQDSHLRLCYVSRSMVKIDILGYAPKIVLLTLQKMIKTTSYKQHTWMDL